MTNRFLISVAAAALIAGTTGFANAQGAGGMKEGTGSTVQQSAPSTGGAASSAPQRGDAASEKAGASESKSMGSGKQAEDSVKGGQKTGKDMKAEGRDGKPATVGQAPAEQKGGAVSGAGGGIGGVSNSHHGRPPSRPSRARANDSCRGADSPAGWPGQARPL